MTFLMILSVKLLSMLMMLRCKCDQVSVQCQELEMVAERKSDLWETVDWGRKCIVDLNAGKTQLVSFDHFLILVLLMWEWLGLDFFWEKSSFKMLVVFFLQIGLVFLIFAIAKTGENWNHNSFYEVSFSWGCSVYL